MSLVALVLATTILALSFTCDDDSGCQALNILHWFIVQWFALTRVRWLLAVLLWKLTETHVSGGSLEAVRHALPSWHWLQLATDGWRPRFVAARPESVVMHFQDVVHCLVRLSLAILKSLFACNDA